MYALSQNIKVKKYNNKHLVFDPFTGAWAFVTIETLDKLQLIKALIEDFKEISLDANAIAILESLYQKGLVSKNGKFSWGIINFNHSKNKINTIILKMVGYCNLACKYCYDYDELRYKLKLGFEKAKLAIDGVWSEAGETLNILFHGGEPMMAKDVIFEIVSYINNKKVDDSKNITYSIQTNGTMFDDEWIEFFIANDFKIGLSLDGTEITNDENRYYHNRKGSYQDIINKINKYPQIKDKIGVLTTVTQTNVKQLFNIALEFKKMGFRRWKTILYQSGGGRAIDFNDEITPNPEDVVSEYLKLLDGIGNGVFDGFHIQSLKTYISNAISHKRSSMCLRNSCGAANDLVSISVDGEIEACDCITNKDYNLGKVDSITSINEALKSDVANNIRRRSVESLFQCSNCDWRIFCGGTCLAKAGEINKVDATECLLSLNLFESIFNALSISDKLSDYAQQ